jgi:hypothetical protein
MRQGRIENHKESDIDHFAYIPNELVEKILVDLMTLCALHELPMDMLNFALTQKRFMIRVNLNQCLKGLTRLHILSIKQLLVKRRPRPHLLTDAFEVERTPPPSQPPPPQDVAFYIGKILRQEEESLTTIRLLSLLRAIRMIFFITTKKDYGCLESVRFNHARECSIRVTYLRFVEYSTYHYTRISDAETTFINDYVPSPITQGENRLKHFAILSRLVKSVIDKTTLSLPLSPT